MPAAIPVALAVGASAAGAGAAAGGVTIAGIALSTTALTAISVGLSVAGALAQTLLAKTPDKPKMQDGDASIKQAKPPRTRCYGRQRLGGAFMYYDSNPDGDLNTLLHHFSHLSGGLEEHWLNDERVEIDGGGDVTSDPWDNHGNPVVTIVHYNGDPGQSVTTLPNPPWTAAHRARGLCCTRIKYSDLKDEEQVKVFPSGPPPYRAVLKGALVYDPRDVGQDITDETTWAWSDNSALVLLDYLTRFDVVVASLVGIVKIPVGFGIDLATQINLTSFATAADVCDEEVERKDPLDPPEPRWRSWGAYDLNEDRKSVLQDLLDACGGQLIQGPDGKIGLSVGAPNPVAAVTLTGNPGSDQLLGWNLKQGKEAISRINVVKASYVSQIWEWAETEAGIQQDQDSIDRNGEQSSELKLRFVPAESQAQRVAKSVLKRGNPKWSGTITGTLGLLDAWGERWVRLQIDEYEIDQVFEISGIRLNRENLTVEANVSSYDGWWDWDAATDEQDPAVFPPNTDEDNDVPVPQHVIVTVEHRALNNGTLAAVGVISWDAPPRSVYVGRARFRPTSPPNAAWQERKAEQDELSVETDPLIDGQQYEAQAKFIGPRGSPSDWSASTLFTAVADPVAPAAPVSISATPAGSTIVLSATASNSSNQRLIRFWRDSDATFAGAVNVGGAIWTGPNGTAAYTDAPGPGIWRYWATAGNWSDIESAATGPTSPITFTPAAPVIVSPTTPFTTNDNTPTYSGTATGTTPVHLFDGATDVGSVTPVAGAWTITASTRPDGTRAWKAVAIAPGPVSSPDSNVVTTTIDTVSDVPVITTASPLSTTDTTPDYTGTSEPGAAISVYRGSSTLAGTGTADGSGNWTVTLSTLAVGPYSGVVAKSVDALGNPQSGPSTPAKVLNIQPPAVTITTAGATTYDTTPTIAGTGATAGATMKLYDDGVFSGVTFTADGSGNWTHPTGVLATGANVVVATQTVNGVESPASSSITMTVSALDSDAAAYIAAMTIEPTSARMGLINDLVLAWKAAGVWSLLDAAYLLAAHDNQASRLNLKAPSTFTLTSQSAGAGPTSPTYTTDRGWKGAGAGLTVGGYLLSTFNPTTALSPHFVRDDAFLGVWVRTASTATSNGLWREIGNSDNTYIASKNATASNMRSSTNSATSITTATAGTGTGFYAWSRAASGTFHDYFNTTDLGSHAATSAALTNAEFTVFKANNAYSDAEACAAVIGSSLTATQEADLHNALHTYLQGVGAVA